MAHRISSQAGSVHSASSWGGEAPPGVGDTASVGHALIADAEWEFGTSPDPRANVLDFTGSGSLRIQEDVTVTVHGEIQGANGHITWEPGAALELIPPAGLQYRLRMARAHFNTFRLISEATPAKRAVIRNGGAGTAVIRGWDGDFYIDAGGMIGEGCWHLQGLGSGSVPAITNFDGAGCRYLLPDSLTDNCGQIGQTGIPTAGDYDFSRSRWLNTPSGAEPVRVGRNGQPGSGRRSHIVDAVFDRQPSIVGVAGLVLDRVVLPMGIATTVLGSGPEHRWHTFRRPIMRWWQGFSIGGDVEDVYFAHYAGANPHFGSVATGGDLLLDGFITEYEGTSGEGDNYVITGTGARTITVRGSLDIPNAGGAGPSATWVTALGDVTGLAVRVENCTGRAWVQLAESHPQHAGVCEWIRSCLPWRPAPDSAARIMQQLSGGSAPDGLVTEASHNGIWNLTDPYGDLRLYASAPGTNDVVGNPQFRDTTRRLRTWAAWRGQAETVEAAFALLSADPTLIDEVFDWVRYGWQPENTDYHGTGYGGVDIGAVPSTLADPGLPAAPLDVEFAAGATAGGNVDVTVERAADGVVGAAAGAGIDPSVERLAATGGGAVAGADLTAEILRHADGAVGAHAGSAVTLEVTSSVQCTGGSAPGVELIVETERRPAIEFGAAAGTELNASSVGTEAGIEAGALVGAVLAVEVARGVAIAAGVDAGLQLDIDTSSVVLATLDAGAVVGAELIVERTASVVSSYGGAAGTALELEVTRVVFVPIGALAGAVIGLATPPLPLDVIALRSTLTRTIVKQARVTTTVLARTEV